MLVDNCAMQLIREPAPVRRDRHREPVRRHPQRRGGHAHRQHRHAALGAASAPAACGCTSPSTARRRTSPAEGIANPCATILSAAMMLDLSFGEREAARAVESGRRDGPRAGRAHRRHRRRRRARRSSTAEMTAPSCAASRPAEQRGGTHAHSRNGEDLVQRRARAWREAKVHVLTHALHYGSGVFEGIRCYRPTAAPAVFRLTEHLKRLGRSAKLYYMPVPVHAWTSSTRRPSS